MSERTKASQRIGQNIARAQGAKTNIAVAHDLKISPSQLSEWRTGSILPEVTTLLELARYFGVPLDDLVKGVDAAYDVAAAQRRAVDLDEQEAALIAAWDTIRQDNESEALGYLSVFRMRVEKMLDADAGSSSNHRRK